MAASAQSPRAWGGGSPFLAPSSMAQRRAALFHGVAARLNVEVAWRNGLRNIVYNTSPHRRLIVATKIRSTQRPRHRARLRPPACGVRLWLWHRGSGYRSPAATLCSDLDDTRLAAAERARLGEQANSRASVLVSRASMISEARSNPGGGKLKEKREKRA